jgi:uncharacterized protein YfdQ (DUF2303 family)
MTFDQSTVTSIAGLAEAAAGAEQLDLGSYYVVTSTDGELHRIDLTGDEWRDQPKHKAGTTTVRDVASFAEYWGKHATAGASEIYANREGCTVTAVLDAHTSVEARWGKHRLVLGLKFSEAFKAWQQHDGRAMDQETFAEFLEDNRADIHTPPAAEMLEIASSLQASTKAEFSQGITLASGQRKLSYVEDTSATAGRRGDLTIPTEIVLAVQVFDGASVADRLTARFRYRITNGKLTLHYKLDRPADVISSAFAGVVNEITDACTATVLRGTPA